MRVSELGVSNEIRTAYPELNAVQLDAIGAIDGSVLLIAGPGSGKTLTLVIRALNILLQGLAEPRELVLCTFTEKAAFELRDRISAGARKLNLKLDLSELQVGTIHSICDRIVMTHRHHTPLGNNYRVLDELTQLLFVFDNIDDIIGPSEEGKYLQRWSSRWAAIGGARNYFNKITEELLDPSVLTMSSDPFLRAIGAAYQRYESVLYQKNCVDFAHQQKLCYQLLGDLGIKTAVKYVMVDEYQDTNYIQEQVLLKLASPSNNICVVGDEDQSLYRFRGSTVRNILEFEKKFERCRVFKLTTNYRSHRDIIHAYDKFMGSCDWGNAGSPFVFRYDKEIVPDPDVEFPEYPAVFCVWGVSKKDEAKRFAELVKFLKDNRVIEDYSQVVLLLHSVRLEHSAQYIASLEEQGIPSFCPRARGYFENADVPPSNPEEPWAITQDEEDFDTSSRAVEERRRFQEGRTQVAVELLAVYLPFHFYPEGSWGVRFFERPTLQFARGVWQEIRRQGLLYDLVRTTKLVVYAVARHEFMHYLTELFGLQLELLQGRQFYRPYYDQVYKKTYPATACIEETVANYWLLDNHVISNPAILEKIFQSIVARSVGAYADALNYDRASIRAKEDSLASQVNQIVTAPPIVPTLWGQLPRPYFQPWTRYENIDWTMNRSSGGILAPILNARPLRQTIRIYHR